jgi:hypothetical protein
VGARRLQGQGQQLHALPRHRDRHRRPARAVPHHPVRGQGQRDVSRRRRARLVGVTYRGRFRFWGKDMSAGANGMAYSASLFRGNAGPLSRSEPEPLARPLRPISRRAGSPSSARWSRSRWSIRRSPRALPGCRCCSSPSPGSASSSTSPPRASTARSC